MFTRLTLAAAAIPVLLLAGCSADDPPAQEAPAVSVSDAWVKAVDDGMTAAFGQLTNNSDHDARIVSATTPSAQRVELHEVVTDTTGTATMRQKEGGLVVPANGELELAPGGDHIMLMDVTSPLTPGSDVEVVATFEDGSTLTITAQVRDFAGADEDYGPGAHG